MKQKKAKIAAVKPNRYPSILPVLQSISPDAVAEYKFHPIRRWKSDWAIPSAKILIEIEGAIFVAGRHSRGAGMIQDMCKYNTAATMGYFVLRFHPGDIRTGLLFKTVREVYEISKK